MSYSIVFSSKTGNTEKLAQEIARTLPQKACAYHGAPAPAALTADTLYIGFWTDKGTADEKTQAFLQTLHGKRVFLFGTAGFGGAPEYFQQILARTASYLPADNVLGNGFMCQGQMPPSVRERYQKLADEHAPRADAMLQNYDRALGHPDGGDLRALANWLTSTQ